MTGQNAIRDEVRNGSGAAMAGEQAPLKLEQFLPYRLNVAATMVSQALRSAELVGEAVEHDRATEEV